MKSISILCLSLLCSAAMAQTLVGVKVDKPQVMAGQAVQATVDLDADNSANCGLRFEWGDGEGMDVRIDDMKKIPYVISHTYAKAGDYTIAVSPKKVTSRLGCIGKAKSAMVKVSAAAAAAAAPAVAVPAAPAPAVKTAANTCPAGWALNTKSVNKKTKAFSCTAKPGTAAPEKKLACEGSTGYFENVKKGVIGCQA